MTIRHDRETGSTTGTDLSFRQLAVIGKLLDDTVDRFGVQGLSVSNVAARRNVFAVIVRPGIPEWDRAHVASVGVDSAGRTMSLWGAVVQATGYAVVAKHPREPWQSVPTRSQIVDGLAWAAMNLTGSPL